MEHLGDGLPFTRSSRLSTFALAACSSVCSSEIVAADEDDSARRTASCDSSSLLRLLADCSACPLCARKVLSSASASLSCRCVASS